jgi:tripartite-type tricarboxylate transporter receptor subunit TctC
MVAPAGTPREIITSLNRNFAKALEAPAVKANIAAEGALAGGNSPEDFAAFIRLELDKYTKLVKAAKLTPES